MAQNFIPKTYNVEPLHVAIVQQVAKDHGASGESAALRFIIEKYVEYEKQYGGNDHQFAPAQTLAQREPQEAPEAPTD